MLTQARVRELFRYDRKTGLLIRRVTKMGSTAGEIAGTIQHGYRRVNIDRVAYPASHVVWLYHKGCLPERELDHRDLNKSNDRIGNLREASRSQNQANVKVRSDNRTGLKGVSRRSSGSYRARVMVGGRSVSLGDYDDPAKASAAYEMAAKRLFGQFARAQ